MTRELRITLPDDWHLHLRDGEEMAAVLPFTARQFGRAVIMPNLRPAVTTTRMARAYRDRILAADTDDSEFDPLMTLYLTDETSPDEIRTARASGDVFAAKLYPAGATTHSAAGVTRTANLYPALEAMSEAGMPLLVHGEVTDPDVDIFDREKVFVDRELAPVVRDFPDLTVVLEHVTTREGIQFVLDAGDKIGATVTPQHISLNRNALFEGGLRPHNYCLPVLKREPHRRAIVDAIRSGCRRIFLGSDSAPHSRHAKQSDCGCAGVFSAHAALELYLETFESEGMLERFEAFASFNGADFYGLPRNTGEIVFERSSWTVPDDYAYGESRLVPFRHGQSLAWRLARRL